MMTTRCFKIHQVFLNLALRALRACVTAIPIFGLLASGVTCHGQAQVINSLDAQEFAFFKSVFNRIGDPEAKADRIQAEYGAMSKLFGLDATEQSLLRQAGIQYMATIRTLRQAELSVASRAVLSQSDRVALAQIAAERDRKVTDLALGFLRSVRPVTLRRLLEPSKLVRDVMERRKMPGR